MREPIQIVPTSMLEEAKKALAEAKKFQAINDELIERSLKLSEENAKLKAENKALKQETANLMATLSEMEHEKERTERVREAMNTSANDYIGNLECERDEAKSAVEALSSELEQTIEELRQTNVLHAETKQELEEAKQAVLGAIILGLV